MNPQEAKASLWKLLVANALSLSVLYLACAVAFEFLRRYSSLRWAEGAALAMESLPARVLQWMGALAPLRELYVYGRIDELTVRLIFGLATVVVVFLLTLTVGGVFGLLRRLSSR